MKWLIIIVGGLFCNKLAAQDTLFWALKDTLAWSDFRGEPDVSKRYLAISSTGIYYTCQLAVQKPSFEVKAFFVRSKSWRNNGADCHVLKHEQGHFDITKIFAIKFEGQLKLLKSGKKTFTNQVEVLGEKIIGEKNAYQRQYDLETANGTKRQAQKRWEVDIKKQLDESLP